MTEKLEGQIERIVFSSEENGFTIARVKVSGEKGTKTVVGNLMSPSIGELIKMTGQWITHPTYGMQFKVEHFEMTVPVTSYGIEKYLGSGLVKGLGPVMAKRIVECFGEESLEIIENDIKRLSEVEGIGKKRIGMIKSAWDEQKEVRQVMLFLQSHNVSSNYAFKIFRAYGKSAVRILRENPYKLAEDIFGIGFIIADNIAKTMGVDENSPVRIKAGILYVLNQCANEGHVYYPYEPLIVLSKEVLNVDDRDLIVKSISAIFEEKKIVIEDINDSIDDTSDDLIENYKAVYQTVFYYSEVGITGRLKKLKKASHDKSLLDPAEPIENIEKNQHIKLADKQKEAVKGALENKVIVITGGPGTGKTTIINVIIKIFHEMNIAVMQAAPTGRAAKRMQEKTGIESKTIHRLLKYSIQQGGFQVNEENQLNCQLLIVDEASMIDTFLMHSLLKAIPDDARLILVGDVNQLPSVGAGNVLRDIISSGFVPVIELNEIFRQAQESRIITNAHKIISGEMPYLKPYEEKDDFVFIEKEDPREALGIIVDLVKTRIPQRFGLDSLDEIQVLTPMHRGVVGAENLNIELQNILNPGDDGIIRGGKNFRTNDKVMQIKNNYDKDVFNGDIGRVRGIDCEEQEVVISFEGRDIIYDFSDLDEVVLSYAISIHKSQGSEYPAVIIPVFMQHYMLLQRNLIYTAVTRGQKLAVVVGTKKAFTLAVKNDKTKRRFTGLKFRLGDN
ncbi:ATP-dependent RecD-like DNA helicase [Spirochaetota bacterium]